MTYKTSYKDQDWLFPVSIKSMISKEHICFFIEEFVDNLNFSRFDERVEGAGAPAYHPRILMKIILQGMLGKERSSRKLSCACRENVVFMHLSEKTNPDFRTLCRFRRQNVSFIKETFKETLKLASEFDLLDLSFIAIDGTTMKANANKKRVLRREQVENMDLIVDKMIEEDLNRDKIDELLHDREENITEMDKRDFRKIVAEYRRAKDKTKLKENVSLAKKEIEKDEKVKKVSLTDSESRMMQNKQRVRELSYNVQFSVDKEQMILAVDVCQDGHDVHQLIPQIENVRKNVKLTNESKVSADCGYSEAENIKYCEDEGIDLFVPSRAQAQKIDGKECSLNHDQYEYDEKTDELIVEGERYKRSGGYTTKAGKEIVTFYSKKLKKKRVVPKFFRERLRMRDKMETDDGREIYSWRKITVEPVIGQVKENLGFRVFCLRGIEGANIEMNIVGTVHNLKKIWRKPEIRKKLLERLGRKGENQGSYGENYVDFVGEEFWIELKIEIW